MKSATAARPVLRARIVSIPGGYWALHLELPGGTRTESEYLPLTVILSTLYPLVADERWFKAAHLGFELRCRGVTIPFTDLVIASAAMEARAVVIDRDHHFDLIAGQHPLTVESYL